MTKKPTIEILSFTPVALWSLDTQVENCAICRNHIMDTCIECQTGRAVTTECTIAWGMCNHAFHSHCISQWLKSKPICPLDTQKWEFNHGVGK
ncbi:hypothetical protein VCUG_00642 [Vavraia culicis subsp. floridensis]|uniref:RING-type domain-containing protein n=1 Tax=Vavraia culicis (isolate floridensis) TaxID=948595 RepID=L2GX57_VAVCU|nr:uncharacterized protein VCUG_00642 [Vavraia culicis subsp. floridensis]ELA47922.1 hypothetical protein VCUG_00642 [Vavraia culicis subsp. floridensis]